MGLRWWAARMGVGAFCKNLTKKKHLRGVCWDPGFPVARKARNCNASDKYNSNVDRISRMSKIIKKVLDLEFEFNGVEFNSKSLSIFPASSRNSLLSNMVDY